jgi:hypothetical protein
VPGVAGAGGRGGAQGDPGAGRGEVAAACGRIEEAAENRSQGGDGGEADEAAGLPWSGVAENRCGAIALVREISCLSSKRWHRWGGGARRNGLAG